MLVGATIQETHAKAMDIVACHEELLEVISSLVQGCPPPPHIGSGHVNFRICWMARDSKAVPGWIPKCIVAVEHRPGEKRDVTYVDPGLPGYTLGIVWGHIPLDTNHQAAMVDNKADIEPRLMALKGGKLSQTTVPLG